MLLTKYKNKKYLKEYKINVINNLLNYSNQIYLFRYTNLNEKEILLLKQNLKKLKFNLIIIKKKLFLPFKTQKGAILLIFSDNKENLLPLNIFSKKLNFIANKYLNSSIIFNKKYFLIFKKLQQQNLLNNVLINKFLIFLYYLSRI
jgi:hypothetical protein